MQRSPILAGFRAVFRAPEVFLAHLAWRWSFMLLAVATTAFAVAQYLDSLVVTDTDMLLLATRIPFLVGHAIANVLRGSGPRLLLGGSIVAVGLTVFWIFWTAVGRRATISGLRLVPVRPRPLLGLNLLRSALALAALLAYLGAFLLAVNLADTPERPRPGVFLLLFVLFTFVIGLVHGRLRGLLVLASVVADRDTFAAAAQALALLRRRGGSFAAVATVMFLLRLGLAIALFLAVSMALGVAATSPRAALLALGLVMLLWLLVSDFLSVVQLAAWVAIAELPDSPPVQPSPPPFVFAPLPPALPPAPAAEAT